IQLAALAAVLPLRQAWVLDTDQARAESLALRAGSSLGIRVEAGKDLRAALRESDVCVTCTPSRRAFLGAADVAPGTFIAAGVAVQGPQADAHRGGRRGGPHHLLPAIGERHEMDHS